MSKNEAAADTRRFLFPPLTRTGVLIRLVDGDAGTPVDNLQRSEVSGIPDGSVPFHQQPRSPTDALNTLGAVIEGFVTDPRSYDFPPER